MQEYKTKQEVEARINALKGFLAQTDYKAIKAFEGQPSEDWDAVRDVRAERRAQVDELQEMLAGMPSEMPEAIEETEEGQKEEDMLKGLQEQSLEAAQEAE